MLTTDAWAYLNIRNPLCAWNTYRGALLSAPPDAGFISVWTAALMRVNDGAFVSRELLIEDYRQRLYPDRVSRLTGIYCFLDHESALRAAVLWGKPNNGFRLEFLSELHLGNAGPKRVRLDSNWITYARMDERKFFIDDHWIPHYWSGDPYPGREPIWETLVEGEIIVLGVEIRKLAYNILKSKFPDSLMLLEISRLASWVGSSLGNICGYMGEDGDELVLNYLMDMRDADNPDFLAKLERLKNDGHPINWADIAPHIAEDSFGKTADLRPFGFRRHKAEMPWVKKKIG